MLSTARTSLMSVVNINTPAPASSTTLDGNVVCASGPERGFSARPTWLTRMAPNRATAEPKTREQLESRGATVVQETPEAYNSFIRAEVAKWAPVVKRAGVQAD